MKLFFNKNDRELLNAVKNTVKCDGNDCIIDYVYGMLLAPHGICELDNPINIRLARAVARLLTSLEKGGVAIRLSALKTVKDIVFSLPKGELRVNTARVLIEIMKQLVRCVDDENKNLKLAHNFNTVSSGNPRIVRDYLKKYHLVEVPEDWSHIAFDYRVHDANSKGRKSPTHLIMDAWIKGIKKLNVVYYNYVGRSQSKELLKAAEIMNISVKISVEYQTCFYGTNVGMMWTLDKFSSDTDFHEFITQKNVANFFNRGRRVAEWQQEKIFDCFGDIKEIFIAHVKKHMGFCLQDFSQIDFLDFVGSGQPSFLHLARFLVERLNEDVSNHLLSELKSGCTLGKQIQHDQLIEKINVYGVEYVLENIISANKDCAKHCAKDGRFIFDYHDNIPSLLKVSPIEFSKLVKELDRDCTLTLLPHGLQVIEIICILNKCRGTIGFIEEFNFKRYSLGTSSVTVDVHELRLALNEGNILKLKEILQKNIIGIDPYTSKKYEACHKELESILSDLNSFAGLYRNRKLKASLGSGSSGVISVVHGMGFTVVDSLPPHARKEINKSKRAGYTSIPLQAEVSKNILYSSKKSLNSSNLFQSFTRRFMPDSMFGYEKVSEWKIARLKPSLNGLTNIITLGGMGHPDLSISSMGCKCSNENLKPEYLNGTIKNILKVLLGFIPAFLTFALTKDWWLLQYFGAAIWFSITGVRNIIQAILGGGGIRRSPFIPWKKYINWSRIADSLFFTGISVPLLDFLVKSLFLDNALGITVEVNPIAVYGVMGIANGIYIFSHNMFRGLPKSAAFGNLARSILSIPIAIFLSSVIGGIMTAAGVIGVELILQKWAAVISKFASDLVAGVIEGAADRQANIKVRMLDFENVLKSIFDSYVKLEVLFPSKKSSELFDDVDELLDDLQDSGLDLDKVFVINSLDMMYLWGYQPRAKTAFKVYYEQLTANEKRIFKLTQKVLAGEDCVVEIINDGIVRNEKSKSLSYYFEYRDQYLRDIAKL